MATPAQQVEAAKSATGLAIDGTRALFGGTRQQGLRAGTSRFLQQGWFVGWKAVMTIYCIVWAAWWDRGEDLDIRIYLATWTHMLATAYFVISLISSLLCMAYLSREKPAPVEEGKPKRPPPVKGTRSPVPCYFRWLQHISWVLTCISSMVVLSVFWMTIYESDVPVTSVYVSSTILALLMVSSGKDAKEHTLTIPMLSSDGNCKLPGGVKALLKKLLDQFLIATEMKFKYAWLGLYFFVVYIFYNVIYYYEHNVEDRVTFEVFDWDERPGRACLWVFLILAFGVPGFTALHVFVYRLRERMYTSYKHNLEVVEEEEPAPKTEKEEKKEAKEKEKEEKKETKEKEKKEKKKEKKDPPPVVVDGPSLLAPAAVGVAAAGTAALAAAPPPQVQQGAYYYPGYPPPPLAYPGPPPTGPPVAPPGSKREKVKHGVEMMQQMGLY